MSMYKLTIAIPTFNRPVPLANTLRAILPQVAEHKNVELIILDNCSKVPAVSVLGDVVDGVSVERVRVIRHPANIGGVYNILRSFEVANGEWLWCLSDDDAPDNDAVATILKDCESCDHCYAYYGLKPGVPNVSDMVDGAYLGSSVEEWVKRIPSYGHRLFISESVFRVYDMRPYMSLAYIVASSGAPHLVMAYCAVSAGGKYLLSDKQIAAYNTPESGNGYNFARLAYGTALIRLVAIKGSYNDYAIFFQKSYQDWISPTVIFRHMVAIHKNAPSSELRHNFDVIRGVFTPPFFTRPIQWAKWCFCGMLSYMPRIGDKLLSLHVK